MMENLDEYRHILDVLKKVYPSIPQPVKPPLTIPVIFGKTYDENFISDYLAYVLHPQKNGIGSAPLAALLELAGLSIELSETTKVKINREYALGKSGRIDLLIQIDDSDTQSSCVIGIENKIFSAEGDGQTSKYAKAIKQRSETRKGYIFLTPSDPAAQSPAFYSISYRQLWESFKQIPYDWAEDLHKSVIWKDFLLHLEFYIVSHKNLQLSEKSKLYVSYHKMIEELRNAYQQDAKRIFEHVEFRIKQSMAGGEWEYDFKASRY